MSVVVRRTGYSYTWICKIPVTREGKKEPCNHTQVAATEQEARQEYDSHKKTVKH